jgi:hypothetical protein
MPRQTAAGILPFFKLLSLAQRHTLRQRRDAGRQRASRRARVEVRTLRGRLGARHDEIATNPVNWLRAQSWVPRERLRVSVHPGGVPARE